MDKKMIAKELISTAKRLMAANVYVQNTEILKQTSKYAEKFKKQATQAGLIFCRPEFFIERDKCFSYIDFIKMPYFKTSDMQSEGTIAKLGKLVRDMEDARLDIQKQIDMEFD